MDYDKMHRMNVIVENMPPAESNLPGFGKPAERLIVVPRRGFSTGRGFGEACLKWIWCQWLLATPKDLIDQRMDSFVERGLALHKLSPSQHDRCLHDLYLVHCAIFASPAEQLRRVASAVVDASGPNGEAPRNNGELYAAAWCGMLKHWILGDKESAARQSSMIWGAYRPPYYRASTKPLVTKWLESDWAGFRKLQQKDFAKLWERARKDGTVRSTTEEQTVVSLRGFPAEQLWCWAHCGMALLAHRSGIEVETDPFWFPEHALKCVSAEK